MPLSTERLEIGILYGQRGSLGKIGGEPFAYPDIVRRIGTHGDFVSILKHFFCGQTQSIGFQIGFGEKGEFKTMLLWEDRGSAGYIWGCKEALISAKIFYAGKMRVDGDLLRIISCLVSGRSQSGSINNCFGTLFPKESAEFQLKED